MHRKLIKKNSFKRLKMFSFEKQKQTAYGVNEWIFVDQGYAKIRT